MALPTHVQASAWGNDVSDVVTLVLTGVVDGSTILVGIAQSAATARTYTVANSDEGNTFTQRQRIAPNRVAEIWSAHNVVTTGGTVTIVITASGTTTFAAIAVEVGNLGTADPFDVANQLDNSSATNNHFSAPSGEIDTSADVYCFAVAAIVNTSGGATEGASWNTLGEPPLGVNGFAQYRISAGALTDERGPFSTTTSRESRAAIASFKAAATASTIGMVVGALGLTGLAASVGTTFDGPSTGAITIAGAAPNSVQSQAVPVPDGTVTLTGLPPGLSFTIPSDVGAIAIAGAAPAAVESQAVPIPAGNIALTGLAPGLASVISPSVGAITIDGAQPSTAQSLTVPVPAGSVAFAEIAPGLAFTTPLSVVAITLEGLAPSPATSQGLPVPAGAIGLTGTAPSLAFGVPLNVWAVALDGLSPGVALSVPLSIGAITLEGVAPALAITSAGEIAIPAGAVVFTGTAPGLACTIPSSAGTIALTGAAPSLAGTLPIPAGAIVVAGLAPSVSSASGLPVPAGAIALTGLAPSLAHVLACTSGSVELTGLAPSLATAGTLSVPAGAIVFTGAAPTVLNVAGTAIEGAAGTITLSGHYVDVLFLGPDTGTITLTGLAMVFGSSSPGPAAGAVVLSGHEPTVVAPGGPLVAGAIALVTTTPRLGFTIPVPVGSLAVTGLAPTCTAAAVNVAMAMPVGAIALTGLAPERINSADTPMPAGAIALTGLAPDAVVVHVLPAGALVLTGAAAEPVIASDTNIVPSPEAGAIVLSGHAPGAVGAYALVAGAVVLSGHAPGLDDGNGGTQGLILLTGFAPDAINVASGPPSPGSGSITLTGQAQSVRIVERVRRPWLRRSPHISAENKRIRHDLFKLVMETGIGTADAPDPEVTLRWSDDGGHTWSSAHLRSAGPKGQYKRRVIWRRLGMARNRVYEVSGTDPVKIALIDAYLNPTVGKS